MYCTRNSMKPLSTADFGKVMKQVYPRVRPRRLGTRGNSRYCYAGMRKRVKLDPPTLPNITGTQTVRHKIKIKLFRIISVIRDLLNSFKIFIGITYISHIFYFKSNVI